MNAAGRPIARSLMAKYADCMASTPDNVTPKVNLGCGTLILIALIVLIFSNAGTGDLKKSVQNLEFQTSQMRHEIGRLSKMIEGLTQDGPRLLQDNSEP